MSSRYRVTLIEPNHVTTRDDQGRVLGSIRPYVPLHTQPLVAGFLKERSEFDLEISVYNPTLAAPDDELPYSQTEHGHLTLHHFVRGEVWDSEKFRSVVRECDIIGITSNFTERSGVAARIAQQARSANPAIKIIYGGSDAFYRPEFYLGPGKGDVVVPKDSELVGHKVVSALLGFSRLEEIPNMYYRDKQGTVKLTCREKASADRLRWFVLPAFDVVANQSQRWVQDHEGPLPVGVSPPIAYVELSRGCHEDCAFCASAKLSYSYMKPEMVARYAEHLVRSGFKAINIVDDNLLTRLLVGRGQGRQDLLDTFRILRESGLRWCFGNGLQFSMLKRRDGTMDNEILEAIFAGCYCAFIPLEDIPVGRDALKYRKLLGMRAAGAATPRAIFEDNCEIIDRIAACGIPRLTFGFIIGYPGDSLERVRQIDGALLRLRDRLAETNPNLEQLFMVHNWMALPGARDYASTCRSSAPELVQFAIGSGDSLWVEERLRLIERLNGRATLNEWVQGHYPRGYSAGTK